MKNHSLKLKKYIIHIFVISIINLHIQSLAFAKPRLVDFSYNKYSQFGDDGIIEKIFDIMGTTSKVCIEFGAWDGFHLSNTANLWAHKGWKGILIESEYDRFLKLRDNIKNYNCVAIHAKIGNEKNDSLDFILKSNNLNNKQVDLLSIDIDGNDYYILESLELKPRLIICEFNPTMPPHLDIYPKYNNYTGSSIAALVRMAKLKGYALIAAVGVNCFFVLNTEIHKFQDFETRFDEIIKLELLEQCRKYVITSFDGKYLIVGRDDGRTPFGLNKQINEPIYGKFQSYDLLSGAIQT